MNISVSYSELETLIRQKTGKAIHLAYAGPCKLSVGYTMSVGIPIIGEIARHFVLDVALKSYYGAKCRLELAADGIAGFALDHLKGVILGKLPTGLVESFNGREVVVNLSSLPKVKEILHTVDINSVDVNSSGLQIVVSMK